MLGGASPLTGVKTSFLDELNKYNQFFSDNKHEPSTAIEQLLKLVTMAEEEIENNGSHAAINWYGWNLISGFHSFPVNVDRGIELLEKAMGMGSSEALVSLADIYSGMIVSAQDEKYYNPERAIHYYRKASEQNDGYATYRLAYCYREGQCVKRDLVMALRYGEKAKDQGSPYGQYLWATWLFDGDILERDQEEAYRLFEDAFATASQQNYDQWLVASLCYWMGYAVFRGEGIEQNKEEGFRLIEDAAAMGDTGAQIWLDDFATHRNNYDIVKDEIY